MKSFSHSRPPIKEVSHDGEYLYVDFYCGSEIIYDAPIEMYNRMNESLSPYWIWTRFVDGEYEEVYNSGL